VYICPDEDEPQRIERRRNTLAHHLNLAIPKETLEGGVGGAGQDHVMGHGEPWHCLSITPAESVQEDGALGTTALDG